MSFSNIANNAIGLFQPDANLEVFLILNGKEYELSELTTEFLQPIDAKGEPQAEIKGGKLVISLLNFPDKNLLYWSINKWIKYNGEIIFRNKTTSAPLRINFKNAYCVNFLHTVSSSRGTSVSLTISPEIIDLNGIFLDNNWSE